MLSVENAGQSSYNTNFGCRNIRQRFVKGIFNRCSVCRPSLTEEEKYVMAHSMPSSILKVVKNFIINLLN